MINMMEICFDRDSQPASIQNHPMNELRNWSAGDSGSTDIVVEEKNM